MLRMFVFLGDAEAQLAVVLRCTLTEDYYGPLFCASGGFGNHPKNHQHFTAMSNLSQEFGVYYGATLQSTALHLLRATATGTSGTPGTHHPRVVGFDSFQGISEAWRPMVLG